MNSLKPFLLLLATAFGLPWLLLIVYPSARMKSLVTEVAYAKEDEGPDTVYPSARPFLASGARVYAANGCAYCHTQMIRPTYAGTDRWRTGWSGREEDGLARETLPHDYLGEKYAYLGVARNGPDLSNVGHRIQDAAWHYRHLYAPRNEVPGSIMPAFRNLFVTRPVVGQVSDQAVDQFEKDGMRYQVVPGPEAEALVGYLLTLKKDQKLPAALVAQ
jgi:cytochrome c oxidase cbb3-type subunit 2